MSVHFALLARRLVSTVSMLRRCWAVAFDFTSSWGSLDSMELFISYSHQDEGYRAELGKNLSSLRRQGLLTEWHDRKIVPGQEWGREIDAHLESAAIIVLLVSPDFIHSEYCWDKEMHRALERHDRGDAVLIPVFIRPVYFEGAPFARVQGLPKDAKPVSTWANPDEAWVDVVRGIRGVIERFRKAEPVSRSPEARTAGLSHGSPAPGPDAQQDQNATKPGARGAILDWLGAEGERMVDAFKEVFGEPIRPFGNRAGKIGGLSDGNEGVQWNLGLDPSDGSCWIGVNLEGMQYRGWPVARLIQRELGSTTLPALIRKVGAADPVEIRWRRDYWQAASRPPIDERWIEPTPISASRLTEELWRKALNGAAACLASPQGGRALQEVTFSKSGTRTIGEVTPHLTIALPSIVPASWMDFLAEGKTRLQPFYDWAVERSSGAAAGLHQVKPTGDQVRIITTVYGDPVAKRGVLAEPGHIATVMAWINAGTLRVRLNHDGRQLLLRNVECEPL